MCQNIEHIDRLVLASGYNEPVSQDLCCSYNALHINFVSKQPRTWDFLCGSHLFSQHNDERHGETPSEYVAFSIRTRHGTQSLASCTTSLLTIHLLYNSDCITRCFLVHRQAHLDYSPPYQESAFIRKPRIGLFVQQLG